MPLIKSGSKRALQENIKTEMDANPGKEKRAQNLAIAYSVQRKNKKKAKGGEITANEEHMTNVDQAGDERDLGMIKGKRAYAKGGDISAADEMRPMPDNSYADDDEIKRNRGMDAEDILSSNFQEKRPDIDNADTPSEMRMMRKASGGPVEIDFVSEKRANADNASDPQDENMLDSHRVGGKNAVDITANEEHMVDADSVTAEEMDMIREYRRMARGGHVFPEHRLPDEEHMHEEADGEPQSVADAVMRKRAKVKMMAEGGPVDDKIASRDSIFSFPKEDQADLSRNADEDANMEDQSSYNALRKENYSESAGLNALDSPDDSNLIGDMIDKDDHDHIDEIRKKMRAKRGF